MESRKSSVPAAELGSRSPIFRPGAKVTKAQKAVDIANVAPATVSGIEIVARFYETVRL